MGATIGKESLVSSLVSLGSSGGHHCVMIGLDSSGKTTILYRLKHGQYTNTAPTIGFNCEKVKSGLGRIFNIWDIGGQDKTRPLWRSYTRATDAIIFVVDSSDKERLEEAKLELQRISRLTERQAVPVLVLANKQDLPTAVDLPGLEKGLGLKDLSRGINWSLLPCCAVTGEGLEEALAALQELIAKRRRAVSRPPSAGLSNKGKQGRKVQRSHSHHF
jgi:ADP-ribosylation factor-like protein 4